MDGVTLRKWKPVGLFSESMVLWEEYLHGKILRARVVVCTYLPPSLPKQPHLNPNHSSSVYSSFPKAGLSLDSN